MQLSKEAKEWVDVCYEEEEQKVNKEIEIDCAAFKFFEFRNQTNNHLQNSEDYFLKEMELNANFANKSEYLIFKKIEIYMSAFEKDKKVLTDSDIKEILEDLRNVQEGRAKFKELKMQELNKTGYFELARNTKRGKDEVLEKARRVLVKTKAERILAENKEDGNDKSKKNEFNRNYKTDMLKHSLSNFQKNIIKVIFESMLVDNDKSILERELCFNLGIDEEELEIKLKELGGKVFIMSADPPGKRKCGLCLIGLLLTDKGKEFEKLLILYLGFVKKQLLIDPSRESVKLKDALDELKLTDEEEKLLTLSLQVVHNPFGYIRNGTDPNVSLPYKATKLGITENVEKYFYTMLDESIDKNMPVEACEQYFYNQEKLYANKNANEEIMVNKGFSGIEVGNVKSEIKQIGQQENVLKKISWLHLTDLHKGMKQQKTLWATVREEFYRDLKRVAEKGGLWDLVLFTGDLTQCGSEEDFKMLENTLVELWKEFNKLGCHPLLVTIPGNHDLLRNKSATAKAFDLWENDEDIRSQFWNDKDSDYRKLIEQVFINYEKWLEQTSLPVVNKDSGVKYQKGLLPGDFSVRVEINDLMIGMVGLNSTFLQLKTGNFEGKLDINKIQVDEACNGDVHKWVKNNHLNILMTHHPPSWFSSKAQEHFKANILDRDNFTFHICGHVHEGNSEERSTSGSPVYREIQGSSLFGYEEWEKGNEQYIQRIHGYNAVYINIADEINAEVKMLPRLLVKTRQGYYKLIADYNYDLEEVFYSRTVPLKKMVIINKEKLRSEKVVTVKDGNIVTKDEIISLDLISAVLSVCVRDKSFFQFDDLPKNEGEYFHLWQIELVLAIEKFTDDVIVVPTYKSSLYFEIPNVIEKTDFKDLRFSRHAHGRTPGIVESNEIQINTHGRVAISGYAVLPTTDKIKIGGYEDSMVKDVTIDVEGELQASVGVVLGLLGKKCVVEINKKISFTNGIFYFSRE